MYWKGMPEGTRVLFPPQRFYYTLTVVIYKVVYKQIVIQNAAGGKNPCADANLHFMFFL
jgi:hypothetical protein